MITNADLTIYNRKLNPDTRQYTWHRTELPGIHWYTDQKVQIFAGDKGLASADLIKIRVPTDARDKPYLPPEEYAALPYGGHTEYWTAENGDLFVRGIIQEEIAKESDLQNKHYVVGKVMSYSDNRLGRNPHIRIGGA